jgi:thiol:disulfide interchange protein DsbD
MSLLMVVLAMFMFDVFTIGVPSSVTSKAGSGEGAAGTVGMGFLAALLATPCSFAILAAVIVWAQSQPLVLGTVTILFIGVGMSIPYIVLTSVPGLINKMPKPGGWMEKVKVAVGFVLLAIAAKLYTALDGAMSKRVLYYGIVLAFCVWMWGKWVGYTTPRFRKWGIRFAAVAIAVAFGFMVFGPEDKVVEFADYDRAEIAELSAAGEPVLVMFTADWCFNCVFVKNRVYKDAEIGELIEAKGVRLFMGDTTSKDDPATADLAGLYDEPGGVPVSILRMPDGELVKLRGMIGKEDMAEVLRKLPDK